MEEGAKNLGAILDAGAAFLERKSVDAPRLAVEMLASRLLGCKRLELPQHYARVPDEKRLAALRRGVRRVGSGEPVQYVIGGAGFMGHEFRVDPRALIPRPETECLVQAVLDCAPLWQGRPAVVDVGTGSGCIVISLALARPEGLYIGLDSSADAVALATENARALGVAERVALAQGEMCEIVDAGSLDAIVSNPPYIPSGEIERLPVCIRDHEPRQALDGGPDGLRVLSAVIQDAALALKPGGRVFLEIGETQGEAVKAALAAEGFARVEVRPDLAGRDRVAMGVLGEQTRCQGSGVRCQGEERGEETGASCP
ncbi:MAG: peptide chain release factor N(5)-glutamine methyltransferase [Lentisphaerae bacterium]|nr:peptide chain release factor N(5)-glutamine methyltransferase [Lentisphaerota bacterium]